MKAVKKNQQGKIAVLPSVVPPKNVILSLNGPVINKLHTERISIDQLFVLQCLYYRNFELLDVYDKNFSLEKALAGYQALERKLFIVPDPTNTNYYIISLDGTAFFEAILTLSNGGDVSLMTGSTQKRSDLFDQWWELFPSTATWTANDGRRFVSGRSLRTGKKEENRRAYQNILNEGIYTHEELMACLRYEIQARRKRSVDIGSNELQYMQGSMAYLNQRTFENFVDLIRKGNNVVEERSSWEAG